MKVRIMTPGWETFTGSLGFRAVFKDGVSVDDLDRRQVARIGANLRIIDIETGLQVGPAVNAQAAQNVEAVVVPEPKRLDEVEREEAVTREKLLEDEKARKEADAAALAEAEAKAAAAIDEIVIYSRQELEAMGANDGIEKLREIAKPLSVKGRAIGDLIENILKAQTKLVTE
ncbi:hypothetical protein ACQKOE_07765 [Novosphingobium sp. NPDC080210]|uniref:hypothetical protein n=1 Tax=Novosphingobium sp. NPDC080210 TaxID=3390596 RepID=UPI003D0144A3